VDGLSVYVHTRMHHIVQSRVSPLLNLTLKLILDLIKTSKLYSSLSLKALLSLNIVPLNSVKKITALSFNESRLNNRGFFH